MKINYPNLFLNPETYSIYNKDYNGLILKKDEFNMIYHIFQQTKIYTSFFEDLISENFHNNPKKTLNFRKTRLNQRAREVFGDNLIIIDKESEIYSLNKNI